MKKTIRLGIFGAALALMSTQAWGEGSKKQSRTGSLEPVNAALKTNYSQVVRSAEVRSGISGSEGRIVRFEVEVPTETNKVERVVVRRGPAVKLMNP
jgi:hypothetical protein